MKLAIIGAGAMGGVFGAHLAEAGQEVTLVDVARPVVEAIEADGLRVDDKAGASRTVRLRATTDPAAVGPVDLAVVFESKQLGLERIRVLLRGGVHVEAGVQQDEHQRQHEQEDDLAERGVRLHLPVLVGGAVEDRRHRDVVATADPAAEQHADDVPDRDRHDQAEHGGAVLEEQGEHCWVLAAAHGLEVAEVALHGTKRLQREAPRRALERQGEPVEVEPYLGADGHLVALREGDLAFLHVHPVEGGDPAEPIRFETEFPTAGSYRLFLQFKHEGAIETAEFTTEAAEAVG